ncbi:MAG: hypothetical protein IJK46_08030 [Prevotella sp.]|nr:hypothetical protein [Prevotella sp.]
MELSRNYIPHCCEVMVALDFAIVSIALYYLEKMGNEKLVTAFWLWEDNVWSGISNSEEYKALCNTPISDYD